VDFLVGGILHSLSPWIHTDRCTSLQEGGIRASQWVVVRISPHYLWWRGTIMGGHQPTSLDGGEGPRWGGGLSMHVGWG